MTAGNGRSRTALPLNSLFFVHAPGIMYVYPDLRRRGRTRKVSLLGIVGPFDGRRPDRKSGNGEIEIADPWDAESTIRGSIRTFAATAKAEKRAEE